MGQRNFGQHRGNDEGWNGVPDWGSSQQPPQQPSPQRGGFGSSDFGSEETSSLEEGRRFNPRDGFNPQGQRGGGSGYEQPQQPYLNEFQQQGFNQGQNEGWGSQPNQGFEPNGYNQNLQGYPQNQFEQNHYNQYGQMDTTASAPPVKKKGSPWSIGLVVVIVAVLLLGIMIFIANKAKQNPSSDLKNKVAQVEKGATDKNTTTSDNDRIFPDSSQKVEGKKEEKTSNSTSSNEKVKEKSDQSTSSNDIKNTDTVVQYLDGAKISSEVLVTKGVVKSKNLVTTKGLASYYVLDLSVGSTSLSVWVDYELASQLKAGDTVTVRYRRIADMDKVVIESITK